MRAEQLLRLHSELMVITTMCRQGGKGENLASAYGDFTKKNIGVLHDAEQTMITYYQNKGNPNPVDGLDRLRTKLGNEFGQKAAMMSAPAFCAAYRDKVLQFDAAAPLTIEKEIQNMEISTHAYVKACHA